MIEMNLVTLLGLIVMLLLRLGIPFLLMGIMSLALRRFLPGENDVQRPEAWNRNAEDTPPARTLDAQIATM